MFPVKLIIGLFVTYVTQLTFRDSFLRKSGLRVRMELPRAKVDVNC